MDERYGDEHGPIRRAEEHDFEELALPAGPGERDDRGADGDGQDEEDEEDEDGDTDD
jgi:hypothetical protein